MQQVYKTFPNNNPITAICVVEDPNKCPTDFTVVSLFDKLILIYKILLLICIIVACLYSLFYLTLLLKWLS